MESIIPEEVLNNFEVLEEITSLFPNEEDAQKAKEAVDKIFDHVILLTLKLKQKQEYMERRNLFSHFEQLKLKQKQEYLARRRSNYIPSK